MKFQKFLLFPNYSLAYSRTTSIIIVSLFVYLFHMHFNLVMHRLWLHVQLALRCEVRRF